MKKSKCNYCGKKLGLIEYDCRCGKKFCIKHRMPEEHNCEYNYKDDKKDLIKRNPKIVNDKIIKI